MRSQRKICVYCGSSRGDDSVYAKAAEALGREIACNNNTLVYGGAKIGLMGILADTVLAEGGSVIGVMPNNLADLEMGQKGKDFSFNKIYSEQGFSKDQFKKVKQENCRFIN